jgi:hypothetical protein
MEHHQLLQLITYYSATVLAAKMWTNSNEHSMHIRFQCAFCNVNMPTKTEVKFFFVTQFQIMRLNNDLQVPVC